MQRKVLTFIDFLTLKTYLQDLYYKYFYQRFPQYEITQMQPSVVSLAMYKHSVKQALVDLEILVFMNINDNNELETSFSVIKQYDKEVSSGTLSFVHTHKGMVINLNLLANEYSMSEDFMQELKNLRDWILATYSMSTEDTEVDTSDFRDEEDYDEKEGDE